ncbi:MAG: vitamin B12-dependent ribonucleotide reductase [FCB group bacterium]|nr:vitamin B12-dependent ribonucleotide reductase [FCB group bacterium]
MSDSVGELFPESELIEQDLELSTNPLEVHEIEFGPASLSSNAKTILEKRYLKKDFAGNPIETPKELFLRVAKSIASVDASYEGDVEAAEEKFYRMMASLDFLPNSPTLMNAGRELGQLSACFVLPVEDSMEDIFETVKNTALIHKSGGGTGFSFSRLRPKNSMVKSTAGTASGPVSFMQVFNTATETVKQGGTRRGANMAMLRVDHPDILEFITCKTQENHLTNFNISVAVTDAFMEAVLTESEYDLISPYSKEVVETLSAAEVFDKMVESAWRNGEPGIVFIDHINRDNPTPHLGEIESTNPCGEQPLLPYESCNLGSINLSHMVEDGEINWETLGGITHSAVHFLDNVIDANRFPIEEISEMTLSTRKIGLGIMGFADLLYQLGIPYDSEEGVAMGEEIMSFIHDQAHRKSVELSEERGLYPAWQEGCPARRNATVTTIAPTGTISMIADASSGIEPNFALAYTKTVLDGKSLDYLNKRFEEAAVAGGFYSEELVNKLAKGRTLDEIENVPEEMKRVFKTSRDIDVKWHILMQAAFQKHTDNAVSKTINFSRSASENEIRESFLSAFRLGCKGLTVYRDGSRDVQVLNTGEAKSPEKADASEESQKISPTPRRRPRTTRGITERVNTGEGVLYITINEDLEGMCEIFTSLGKNGGNAAAQSEAISRLISLCLRCGIDTKSIIKQLKGIAGPNPVWDDGQLILSTPDAIGKVLERQATRKSNQSKSRPKIIPAAEPVKITDYVPTVTASEPCPDCNGVVVYEEGCKTCHSCGFSQCG